MEPYILEDRLRQAIDHGDLEGVKSLIAKGVDINAKDKHGLTPLHWAVTCNTPEILVLLINSGCDINAHNEKMDMTPLCLAAHNGAVGIVSLLIEHGARTDITDAENDTPYEIACAMKHHKIIAMLENTQAITATA